MLVCIYFLFVSRIFCVDEGCFSRHEDMHSGDSMWYAPCVGFRMFVLGVLVMLLMTWGGQTLGRGPSRIICTGS